MKSITLKEAYSILKDSVILPQSVIRNKDLYADYPYELGHVTLNEFIGQGYNIFMSVTNRTIGSHQFVEGYNEYVSFEGSIMTLWDAYGSEWKFKVFVPYNAGE